ncbi:MULTISPECIES: polyphosphate polymerase domain-containing protein [unclassified Plantactinospora]|uniref:polyphosphate polymerase domain-containing protein n=1 Tax=unclassified Plantactinospora TaxID=2631981 RepID=UPI000D1758EE|nr:MULTISPECIES: polyphosphate polymerase domain-containing protein [unclassified Plantactinospora]AVT30753.1 molecular chaperone [Plantactinospora sp. BC1]AVT37437.1 molecular chaperone [Plantactinospora sp. BB1]
MTSTAVDCALPGHLDPIGLDELTERAALQTRVDRKYVLPLHEARAVVAQVGPDTLALEIDGRRSFEYRSVYFDTPELTSYLLTAQRRRRRFKVRTRTYLDSAECWLEVKTQGPRGNTVKDRLPYRADDETSLSPGRQFVDGVLARESIEIGDRVFAPVLVTRYRRSTLFLAATVSRVTIDTELTWEGDDGPLQLPGLAVVETKTGSTASWVDRLLWARGHRPTRISKYATGLAALRPDLPSAPWRRTLRRHFTFIGATDGHRSHLDVDRSGLSLVASAVRPANSSGTE